MMDNEIYYKLLEFLAVVQYKRLGFCMYCVNVATTCQNFIKSNLNATFYITTVN